MNDNDPEIQHYVYPGEKSFPFNLDHLGLMAGERITMEEPGYLCSRKSGFFAQVEKGDVLQYMGYGHWLPLKYHRPNPEDSEVIKKLPPGSIESLNDDEQKTLCIIGPNNKSPFGFGAPRTAAHAIAESQAELKALHEEIEELRGLNEANKALVAEYESKIGRCLDKLKHMPKTTAMCEIVDILSE